jgi:hypothetical protein
VKAATFASSSSSLLLLLLLLLLSSSSAPLLLLLSWMTLARVLRGSVAALLPFLLLVPARVRRLCCFSVLTPCLSACMSPWPTPP